MLVVALLFLGVLRYRALFLALVPIALLSPAALPVPVAQQASDTVAMIQNWEADSVHTNSLSARVSAWRDAFRNWIGRSPLLGVGVGNARFSVDSEYVLRWSESGVIGLAAFLWLLGSIGRFLWRAFRGAGDAGARAVAAGTLTGFVTLLIQAIVAPAFTSIRIMEPFYLMLGLTWVYLSSPAEEEGRKAMGGSG
jgi:O-antigen ligase